MPQRDPRRTVSMLRQLLDHLDADLAGLNEPVSSLDSTNAAADEERHITERVETQLAKLRAKPAPGSFRRRKAS